MELPLQGNGRKDKYSGHHDLGMLCSSQYLGDPSPIDILGDDDDDMDQSLNGDVSPIASDVRDKIMDYLPA